MESLAVELLEEIGLYLDPITYHFLRESFNILLPFVQRVLPCYFDYPKVQQLLKEYNDTYLNRLFKITEMNQRLIKKLLEYNQFGLLVPFSRQVLEVDSVFYHPSRLKIAIMYHQSLYITKLFQIPTCSTELSNLKFLYT